jgi:hypothetical protein
VSAVYLLPAFSSASHFSCLSQVYYLPRCCYIEARLQLTRSHDLYKWQQDHQRTTGGPQRSASFSHLPTDRTSTIDPSLAHIREPGGFRRNFVVNKAQEQGLEPPTLVRNVVDFLFLYGHFVSCPSPPATANDRPS